jgi:hypothetical protein
MGLKVLLLVILLILLTVNTFAKITGPCVNCHTMHNSQNGAVIATYGADGESWKGTGPYPALTRGTCLGCHGMGTSSNIVNIGGSEIPQVFHTDTTDLAGGNFAYITGAKSRVTADQNSAGHNVIDLGPAYLETQLTLPPGQPHGAKNTTLTCAGVHGCHGFRDICDLLLSLDSISVQFYAMKGAHHQNTDGKCENNNRRVYGSYRFLWGVKGLENPNSKWQNVSPEDHNEYFGDIKPLDPSSYEPCAQCHASHCPRDPDSPFFIVVDTISGFCATCHRHFHLLEDIGGDTSSPFTRHPTDVILPSSGEYSAYTTYSVEAPVARTTVPDTPSDTVTPGTDVVMCLSCHSAHATPYEDMLRWNYSDMVAGGSGSGGCFTCHTQKNQPP